MEKTFAEEKEHEFNADGFLQIVQKYFHIEELTVDILHEFIDRIVVHYNEKVLDETIQQIEIYYKIIGYVKIPTIDKQEKESYIKSFRCTKKSRLLNK